MEKSQREDPPNTHRTQSAKHRNTIAKQQSRKRSSRNICIRCLHDPFFIFGLVKFTPGEVERPSNKMFGLSVRSLRSRAFCLRSPDLDLQPGQSTSQAANQPERQPASKQSGKPTNHPYKPTSQRASPQTIETANNPTNRPANQQTKYL